MERAPSNVYTEMEATGPAAQQSIDSTVGAYEAGQTQDYQTYWNFRNQESDDYVGGLTQGQTYYVVINSADPGVIGLSTTDPERDAGQHYGLAPSGQRRRRRRPAAPLHRLGTYVTFDSSSSTIDNTTGTIN